jgi:hypothetical protein
LWIGSAPSEVTVWLVFVMLLSACAAIAPRLPVPFVHAHDDWLFVDPGRLVARAGGAATPRRRNHNLRSESVHCRSIPAGGFEARFFRLLVRPRE